MDMGESAALKIDIHKKQETKKKVKQKGGILEMKKKSKVAKVLALCLAMVMMLSMSMTAFAVTSSDTADFDVTGFDTDPAPTVTAYQIITVNIDDNSGQPEYPMYAWADAVAGWVTDNYAAYIDQNLGTNAVADAFADAGGDDMTTFLEEMAAAIKDGTITGITFKSVAASNGTASFEDMAMGEYLITANGGVKIYQPTTVKVVPVYDEDSDTWSVGTPEVGDGSSTAMKSQEPSIGKEVADGDTTVAVGDIVEYKLTVTIPDYPTDATAAKLEVGDTLSAGLTYNGDVAVYSDEAMETVISETGVYTDVEDTTTLAGKTFLLQFDSDYILAHGGETIYVGYTATVNEDAFDSVDALGNKAFLGYNNDPYNGTSSTPDKETEEEVYSYAIDLTKVGKEGNGLSGAAFTLTKDGEAEPMEFAGITGEYTYHSDNTGTITELTVANDGSLMIKGLDEGTYILKETKAPADHVLPNGQIEIRITDQANGAADGTIDGNGTEIVITSGTTELYENPAGDDVTITGNTISFKVQNTSSEDAGFNLPQTGGMGTMIFTIAGIILMAGAITMVVVISRKKRA